MRPHIVQVALPVPLDRQFDYLIEAHHFPVVGGRVRVPFGPKSHIGIVTGFKHQSDVPTNKLKPITQVIDHEPLWPQEMMELIHWCAQYYQYPLGDSYSIALPSALRKGKAATHEPVQVWSITDAGRDQLAAGNKRAPKQHSLLEHLSHGELNHAQLSEEFSSAILKTVQDKGWIQQDLMAQVMKPWSVNGTSLVNDDDKPQLNEEQAIAIGSINAKREFGCYLLQGVTGSGKTEVYLNAIEPVLERGGQALVLVPEIGLTPQTISRFKNRFNVPVTVVHSALNESEKLNAWLDAKNGTTGIVIGTRSALFTPFKQLGIIIVDEEHDSSYKQQDTLRYHARDLAVMRANKHNIPVLLGSATPSIESLYNAERGKYHHLALTARAGNALPTTNQILDIKGQYLEAGLSGSLIAEMRRHLDAGNQVMLFLNRRGFSPAMMCHECGWTAECQRCDAFYTYHASSQEMRCHHCGSSRRAIAQCRECGSHQMVAVGVGTEQLEAKLNQLFPDHSSIRIDRDSTRRKGSLQQALDSITQGKHDILIGTQMLAKGHHFPDVTLVALLDVDASLYSSDFRAAEKLAQLYIQVAGRAGRASKPGHVLLQTHHPEHPLLNSLTTQGYETFAQSTLVERQQAMLPPYSFLALFRAEAHDADRAEQFLRQVRHIFEAHPIFARQSLVLGPTPAPMAKRAGKSRWQLMLQTEHRTSLLKLLASAKPAINMLDLASKVRWSIDVEPQDLV
ncbi:primosomal protein N' [Vibrio ulleungensis]|uniref:Replication restart protein PriA n=1 Tax=Vibrio ulleungensis TaxID=2807619 RepID=A0ABS2HMJ3_9VIBR|nr:primosomal protein N' [Vibrio ulleungensis]MBM7037777.1 primosomal protein N' [Vibrio ulleungensis]